MNFVEETLFHPMNVICQSLFNFENMIFLDLIDYTSPSPIVSSNQRKNLVHLLALNVEQDDNNDIGKGISHSVFISLEREEYILKNVKYLQNHLY